MANKSIKRYPSKYKGKRNTVKRRTTKYDKIWGNIGRVYNAKTNKYVRLGSSESMSIIKKLPRNAEWTKRVNYMIRKHGEFGAKLKHYLDI